MAATVVKTLLVFVCISNIYLFCVQAGSWQPKKAEADYTIEPRDAKVVSFSPEYFSKKTTIYTTMYNDSFTVIDGIIEFLKTPPADAMMIFDAYKYDSTMNQWSKGTSSFQNSRVCDFIKNNAFVMNKIYKFSNFTAKECPIYPGVYAIQHLQVDTEGFPNHASESTYRADIGMQVKDLNKPAIFVSIILDVVSKPDNEDD